MVQIYSNTKLAKLAKLPILCVFENPELLYSFSFKHLSEQTRRCLTQDIGPIWAHAGK